MTSIVTSKGSITQNQDAATTGPNVVLDIEQNQRSGFKCTTGPLQLSLVGNQQRGLRADEHMDRDRQHPDRGR